MMKEDRKEAAWGGGGNLRETESHCKLSWSELPEGMMEGIWKLQSQGPGGGSLLKDSGSSGRRGGWPRNLEAS